MDQLSKDAMYVAMCVRNAMEDFHHRHLGDRQMAELNPIIRNAIYTALFVLRSAGDDLNVAAACTYHHAFQTMLIPDYWEAPEHTSEFSELLKLLREKKS